MWKITENRASRSRSVSGAGFCLRALFPPRSSYTTRHNKIVFVNSFLFSLFSIEKYKVKGLIIFWISNLYFRDDSVAICGGDDRNSIKNSEKTINTSCGYGIVLGRRFFWFSCNINFSKVLSFVDLKDAKSANLEGFELQWTIMGNQVQSEKLECMDSEEMQWSFITCGRRFR